MKETALSIGGIVFRLCHPELIVHESEFDPFRTDSTPDVTVNYIEDASVDTYASEISDVDSVTVRYGPERASTFATLRGCLMYTPIEDILLRHNRFILHASVVTSRYGAILFTADSGVGKSTQAELWRRHRGSEILNGDRALLAEGERWLVYGSLYAGSSGYYTNRSCEVGAVIILEQGDENKVTSVSEPEAFRLLLLQCMTGDESEALVGAICDLVEKLIESVTVYRLTCTPDENAVAALEKALRKESD